MLLFKLIKWIGGLVLTLAIFIVLAIIILPRFVDPNDYRDEITELVRDKTGRELVLNGDLSLSVFPWLGIRTEELSISQPEEIGGSMLQVQTAQLRVKAQPLLSKRIEIDTVILEQPELRFVTLANGINSLSGLSDDDEVVEEETDSSEALALVIQGVEITDANLEWDDRQEQQRYQVSNLNLVTGNLIGSSMADINLSGTLTDLSGTEDALEPVTFSLDGQALIDTDSLVVTAQNLDSNVTYGDYQLDSVVSGIEFDTNAGALKLDGLSLSTEGEAAEKAFNMDTAIASLTFDVDATQVNVQQVSVDGNFDNQHLSLSMPNISANLDAQTASLGDINLSFDDLQAQITNLQATQFKDNPSMTGALTVPTFNAANLMKKFEVDYETPDANALSSVSFSSSFNAGTENVALSNIALKLDDTNLTGDFAASDFAEGTIPGLKFDLVLDRLNLDRYVAESEEEETEEAAGGADALVLPMSAFKDFNANGSFKAQELISSNVTLTDINVLVESSPGRVAITPKADLYDGDLAGSMVYTEQGDTSTLHVKNTIGIVDLAKFFTDADITEQLTGFGSVDMDVTVTEKNGQQTNSGTIKLLANDGSVRGVDIKGMVDKAYSTYQQFSGGGGSDTTEGASAEDDATGFAELIGTFNLNNSVLSNNDFSIKAPFFRINGSGNIDLAAQDLDYSIDVSIVNSSSGQGGAAVENLAGLTLPIKLSGSFEAPSYSLDTKALYTALAKSKVEEKKNEFLEEKLGITVEGDERISTKDILQGLITKEVLGDDEAQQPAEASQEQQQAEVQQELTPKEEREDLKDELKRKVLNGLFN